MQRKYTKLHILFEETASTISIDLETMKTINWQFDEPISIDYKTADRCKIKFETRNREIEFYEGYVPDFFPNKHWGDYIMLNFKKDGTLKKWNPSDIKIDQLLKKYKEWINQ